MKLLSLLAAFIISISAARAQDSGTIMIFGATSGSGLEIAKVLTARGDDVTAFVRPTSNMAGLEPLKVKTVRGDAMNPADVKAAFDGRKVRAVISTIGGRRGEPRPDFEANRNVIDAAKAAGVRRMVLVTTIGTGDSYGAITAESKKFLAAVIPLKDQAEKHLIASGLDYTIVRPGGLNNGPVSGRGELLTDQTTMGSISRAELATLVVRALDDPKARGAIYHALDRDTLGTSPR
jgi:uncharacterized protein YbjT (DUF2867 family)